jgi:hypothetical protein
MCSQAAEDSHAPPVKPSLQTHGSQQRPCVHLPVGQTRPHPPQFLASVMRFAPPQGSVLQAPASHCAWAPQAWSHDPQLS